MAIYGKCSWIKVSARPHESEHDREENRVSELVRPIPVGVCLVRHPPKHLAILKRTEQIVVAGAWFVDAGHDRVHASEGREPDRCAGSRSRRRAERCRQHAPRVPAPARRLCQQRSPCHRDRRHASINRAVDAGMSVRLVERQQPIELGVARRRNACGEGQRGKRRSASTERADHRPIEDEAR